MRIDLVVPNQGHFADKAVPACGEFEQMGFDGLWFTDHVVGFEIFKPVYDDYWFEVLNAVSYVAGITTSIRLGIGVLVIPYRDAVLTAKSLATIDKLSGGRLDLGIGTGWSRAEFYALGRQQLYEARGAYTNEALDVMMTCWQEQGEIAFQGDFHNFRKVQFEPKPVQRPRIPFWIGARGTAKAPLHRAAKYADVWHPTGLSPSELTEGSDRINELAGREVPTSIRGQVPVTASTGEMQDWLGGYREAGCIEAAVDMKTGSFDEFMEGAARLAEARATFA